jgi:hypothetical protein
VDSSGAVLGVTYVPLTWHRNVFFSATREQAMMATLSGVLIFKPLIGLHQQKGQALRAQPLVTEPGNGEKATS